MTDNKNSTFYNVMQAKHRKQASLTVDIDMTDAKAVQDSIMVQLKTQAINGDLTAIKEYTRLYLPKNGMQSFVEFTLPPGIASFDSKSLSRILKELLRTVSKGQMSLEQFKELSTAVKNMIDTTEIAELEEKVELLTEIIEGDPNETEEMEDDRNRDGSGPMILDHYRSMSDEDKERFKGTASNAVIVGRHAAKEMAGDITVGDDLGDVE